MEHNQLAVLQLASYSDSSFGDNSTIPISQSDQVIPERGLSDLAKFKDHIFRKGERYSAKGGASSGEGSQYREPETTQPQNSTLQTTVPAVVSEVGGLRLFLNHKHLSHQ